MKIQRSDLRGDRWPPHIFRSYLLGEPSFKLLREIVLVIGPELVVEEQRILSVVRIGRHMRLHVNAERRMFPDHRRRRVARRAVRNEFGLICKPLRIGCITHKFLNGVEILVPFGMIQPSRSKTCQSQSMPIGCFFLLR